MFKPIGSGAFALVVLLGGSHHGRQVSIDAGAVLRAVIGAVEGTTRAKEIVGPRFLDLSASGASLATGLKAQVSTPSLRSSLAANYRDARADSALTCTGASALTCRVKEGGAVLAVDSVEGLADGTVRVLVTWRDNARRRTTGLAFIQWELIVARGTSGVVVTKTRTVRMS